MMLAKAYSILFIGTLCVQSVLIIACFVRAVKGPSIADRIVAINMIGTQTLIMIGLVALLIGEGYLTDVALIYAMISFLAVVVLCKVYMGVFLERQAKMNQETQDHA